MKDYTEILSKYAEDLRLDDISSDTIDRVKMCIADYYAASIAGYKVNTEFNNIILSILRNQGGCSEAQVLFEKQKYPAPHSAFVNAAFAHGADMDDGNRKAAGHIGTHVIPAVFAVAESRAKSWKEVFVSIIVGYDFFNRIAGAAQPNLYNKGFHSTGVAGGIACAAACAKLLGLDSHGIYNSVSIAAVQSGGLIIIDESGQQCKPINPANAAKIGVLSAFMAEKGLKAPDYPLESKKGWFQAFSGEFDSGLLNQDLGKTFTINESYLKLYPACRHVHSCIDAVLNIRKEMSQLGKNLSEIDKIYVFIYSAAIKSAGSIRIPRTEGEAKFSIYYAVAVALCFGRFDLNDLRSYGNLEIQSLCNKIELIKDDSLEDRNKGIRGSRVKVVFKNEVALENTVLIPKGEGSNPLTWDDIESKMKSCSEGVIDIYDAVELVDACKNINLEDGFLPLLV